jgi:hypothetical protein
MIATVSPKGCMGGEIWRTVSGMSLDSQGDMAHQDAQ